MASNLEALTLALDRTLGNHFILGAGVRGYSSLTKTAVGQSRLPVKRRTHIGEEGWVGLEMAEFSRACDASGLVYIYHRSV